MRARCTLLLCLTAALLFGVASATLQAEDEVITSATPDIIMGLHESAQADRIQVEEELKRARQWRELADQARAHARSSIAQEDIESWNKDADYNDQQAQRLEDTAARLKALAEQKESRAERLERALQEASKPKPAAAPPPKPAPAGPSEAEVLQVQAQWQRSRAADLTEVAGRWRSAALHLRALTAQTTSPARLTALQETIDLYEAQSRRIDAEANEATDAAAALEALAAQMPPDFRRPDAPDVAPPETFEGRWEEAEDQASGGGPQIVIRRLDRNPEVGFALDSRHNHWLGRYDPEAQPKYARMSFWFDPEPKQLNLEIPEWARKQVARNMEWRLDFDADPGCGIEELTAKWYPGEVTWDETARKAWVTGIGNPILIKYKRIPEPEEELTGNASIYAVAATKVGGDYPPVRAVPRGMPFRLKAVLPSKLGEAVGQEMTAKISGANGDFAVTLSGQPTNAGPWIYTSAPIQFQRYRDFDERLIQFFVERAMSATSTPGIGLSFGELSREADSNSATFKTGNGEAVRILYGDAESTLAVFDDYTKFGVYQVRRSLNDQEIALQSVLLLNAAGDSRADIERKLGMILNARTYLDYEPGMTETWPEQMGMAIGLQYLRLLNFTADRDWNYATQSDDPNDQGVVFVTTMEKSFVEARIEEVKDRSLSDYFSDLADRVRSGIDEKKAINHYLPFDVEDLKIAVMGEDWAGRPVDRMTRALSGTRLSLQVFVTVAGVYGEAAKTKGLAGAVGRDAEVGLARMGAAEGAALKGEGALARMSAMEGPSEILKLNEPGVFPRPVIQGLEPTAAEVRATMTKKLGTAEFEVLKPTQAAVDHAAAGGYCVRSGCTLASITYLLEERGIAEIASDTLHKLLKSNFGINVVLEKGANMTVVRDILEGLYGATAKIQTASAYYWGNFINIEKGLRTGARYITAIRYATGEIHAVVITGVERASASSSSISKVVFFDVNAGAEIRMSCSVFREKLWLKSTAEGAVGKLAAPILEVTFK